MKVNDLPMKSCWNKPIFVILTAALAGGLFLGCTSKRAAQERAQAAYLAGQNAALMRQQDQISGVTVLGPVQNSHIPWVVGLTLAQAIATANYLSPDEPTQITLTRQGEDATIDPKVLLNGVPIPLESGDVITLK